MSQQIVTIFSSDLQPNLFPNNAFYKNSKLDASGVEINAKTINVPEGGNAPEVIENPAILPLTIEQRVDNHYTYNLDLVATKPQFIQDVNEAIANYSIREGMLKDHALVLNTRVADKLNYAWSPTLASNILRTTGAAGTSLAPGATGTRKKITKEDLIKVRTLLSRMDVGPDSMFGLIDAQQYGELLEISDFVDYNKTGKTSALEKGLVGELLSIKFYERSKVQVYTNDATPVKKAIGAATATTDNLACLFWGESYVRRAEGSVKVYSKVDEPTLLGSYFNAAARVGGIFSRTDQKGVVSLVQAHG